MNSIKFPKTPHLFVPNGLSIRDDKVMSESEQHDFLSGPIIIEEKVDGANLGIFMNDAKQFVFQNRNHQFESPGPGQFEKLRDWAYGKYDSLNSSLGQRYILFGEWCYAKHSITYNKLPDWFIGFDLFDKSVNKFLSVRLRNGLFQSMGIHHVPLIAEGLFIKKELENRMDHTLSAFGPSNVEGFYLRRESGQYLTKRAKLVRPGFIQNISTHWSKHQIIKNTFQ